MKISVAVEFLLSRLLMQVKLSDPSPTLLQKRRRIYHLGTVTLLSPDQAVKVFLADSSAGEFCRTRAF